ncbi:MAG TPA: sigma 54-interacting transcriptional regulator, partial [Bryobacteraceae bacterium]|nr:sigma 54-interacting transcriptional regulator [Bryobacteraceae bacterium]
MQARIRIADLPDAGRRRCTGWQLSHEIDGERRSHLLSEGEFCVGSGAEADVRICAPGVRSRHLRLKCDSTSVYLQPLGNAAVVLDSELVRGLTRVSPSEPFRFGSVCAWIERLAPEDDIAALSIPAASVHPHTEKERDSAAASLQALNAVLEDALSTGTMPTADRLLEALDESQAPISAALFRIEGDDRAVLAERAKPGAPTGQALLEAEGTRTYRWTARGAGRELAVLYSESSAPVWQDQLAYQILLLSALSSIAVATPKPAATRDSSAGVDRSSPWHRLIGSVLRAELARSTDMCRCADSVLVLGETGTGKELAARSLHELWGRSGEFVALNCAAIPGELLDAEFFGIEPGTATGVAPQAGRIEQARGGTLFLDEISEMPMALQSKLLRVLQEREYFRLGGAKLLKADVKIVAASNLPEEE